ncbi:MAG: histone family protein [Candidatus Micrarchaeota archaeon]
MARLPIAPIDRLIRDGGANRVSECAAQEMAGVLEEYVKIVASKASVLATHAGRKTVTARDIKLAVTAS